LVSSFRKRLKLKHSYRHKVDFNLAYQSISEGIDVAKQFGRGIVLTFFVNMLLKAQG